MSTFSILSAPRYDTSTHRWIVDEKDSKGNILKSHDKASKKEADQFIKDVIINNDIDAIKETPKNKADLGITNMLESSLDNMGDLGNIDGAGKSLESLENDRMNAISEFKERWESRKKEFSTKATLMIDSIADFYFEAGIIKKNQLIGYKKEMHSGDISVLLEQAEIARRAIDKLAEKIEMGDAQPRVWEVLAQMQKLVLDLIGTKSKFMKDIDEDFKSLRDEIMMAGIDDTVAKETATISIKSTKEISNVINIFLSETATEMNKYLQLPSKNKKLAQKGDTIEYEEIGAVVTNPDEGIGFKSEHKGLDTFE